MPSFQIVRLLEDGKSEVVAGYPPFEDGKQAKFYADQLALAHPGFKYQPRPIIDDKTQGGHTQKDLIPIPFWSFSPNKGRKGSFIDPVYDPKAMVVRYFANEASRQSSKSTSTDLQSFLSQLFYQDGERAFWTRVIDPEWFNKNYTFGLARTEEEIIDIYKGGLDSCMSKADHFYVEDEMPVKCYATEDFGVFWIRDRNTQRLKGRVVVSPTRKVFSRIYGNELVLGHFLRQEGYRKGIGADWVGLKFPTKHLSGSYTEGEEGYDEDDYNREHDEGYMAPYMDSFQSISLSEDQKWFIISPHGEYEACCTHGLASTSDEYDDRYICHECQLEILHPISHQEGTLCYDCAKNKYGLVSHTNYPPDSYDLSTSGHPPKHTDDGYLILRETYYYQRCSITNKVYGQDQLPFIFDERLTPAEAERKYNEHWPILKDAFVSPPRPVANRGTLYQEVSAAA